MEDNEKAWEACKIVEEDENGELKLLPENLEKLQKYLDTGEDDITSFKVVSVIGARENENAFLTNLLPLYLKKQGKSNWSNVLSTDGLEGFAFGNIVEKKAPEIISGENSNEENLLQRAANNQQHPSFEENHGKLGEENMDHAVDGICTSLSRKKLAHDESDITNANEENGHSENPTSSAMEHLMDNISEENLRQLRLYTVVSKLILRAGILPPAFGNEISNASKAMYFNAEKFEKNQMNVDTETEFDDFEFVDNVNSSFHTFDEFARHFETLIKLHKTTLIESGSIQTQTDEHRDETKEQIEIKTDQLENHNRQVETNSTMLVESDNLQGTDNNGLVKNGNVQDNSNNGQGESENVQQYTKNGVAGWGKKQENSNNEQKKGGNLANNANCVHEESGNLPENDKNGQGESGNLQETANNGQGESGNLQETANNGQGESGNLQETANNGQGESGNLQENVNNGQGESGNLQENVNNIHEESDNPKENGNNGQEESGNLKENDNNKHGGSSNSHENSSNVQGNAKNGLVERSNVQREFRNENLGVCVHEQGESINNETRHNDTNEITDQQNDGRDVTKMDSLHPENSDQRKHKSNNATKLFQPGESKNALYVYPEIISSENDGRHAKWCILHLHIKSNNNPLDDQKFERFLVNVCTSVVWISYETTAKSFQDELLDSHLSQKIINIVIENEEKGKFLTIVKSPTTIHVTKDNLCIYHDGSGILNLHRRHLFALSTLLKSITEFEISTTKELEKNTTQSECLNFSDYITRKVEEFNSSPEFEDEMKPSKERKALREPPLSAVHEHRNTSVSDAKTCQYNKKGEPTTKTQPLNFGKVSDHPENKVIEATTRLNLKKIEQKLGEWIENKLDMGNVRTIFSLYETFLADICKKVPKNKEIEKVDMTKVKEAIKQRVDEKCKPLIEEVVGELDLFSNYFQDQFKINFCYRSKELERKLEEKRKIMNTSQTEEVLTLINLGYEKLADMIRKHNKQQINLVENISMETKHKIRTVYKNKLEQLLSSKIPLDPEKLWQFHDDFTSILLAVYEKCLDKSFSKPDEKMKLQHNLLSDFQEYFERNMLLLELSQKKVKGFIGKSKSGYEEIMDNLLKKNKCGVDPDEFEKTHLDESKKAEMRLKRSIQTDEGLYEPTENHLVTLKKHIEKSYKTFKEDNEEFLEKSKNVGRGIGTKSSNKISQISHPNNPMKHYNASAIDNQSPRKPEMKESKKLPPLLYQIALSKIGVATWPKNSWESFSGNISIHSNPGDVGILLDGKWVCGDDVKEYNQRGKVQKAWSLEKLFDVYDFNDTITVRNDTIHVTLPFLLGIFLGILKQKAENEHHGKISAAIVSIPFWFSTYKRRQVTEAGTIAGFDYIQLVNENTAAGFYAYTNGLSSPNQKMVVISENSNRVDITIYSYDQQSKTIYMRGQSGDYETAQLSKDKGYIKKFVTGILLYLFYNQQETGIQEKALESLDKLWVLAKSRVHSQTTLKNNVVLIYCESDRWREFLWKFAEKITSSENILVRNDVPLQGVASLVHAAATTKNGSIEPFFKDAIPFDVILSQGTKKFVVLKKSSTFSYKDTQDFHFELPKSKSAGCFTLYEEGFSLERIGVLLLKSNPPLSYNIEVTLKQNRCGKLIITAVDYVEESSYGWGTPKKPLPDHYLEWQACKTTDVTLAAYRSIMDQINLLTETTDEGEDVLKLTEEKAEKIKEVIQANTGKFKSSMGRNLVIRQIDDILESLKQPGTQGKLLKKHASYLDSIVQKYNLQI